MTLFLPASQRLVRPVLDKPRLAVEIRLLEDRRNSVWRTANIEKHAYVRPPCRVAWA